MAGLNKTISCREAFDKCNIFHLAHESIVTVFYFGQHGTTFHTNSKICDKSKVV
jgi:hypothetical protein